MKKVKKIERQEIERKIPDYSKGLSDSDVTLRVNAGYHNKTSNSNYFP